jgi:FemAB-related protein (PEP-CTERM system-associated)
MVETVGQVSVSADVTSAEWDAYVDEHPEATGNHLWAWRQVYETAFGHRTQYLAARRTGGRLVGILPLVVFDHWMFGRFMVSLPFVNYGGVLADDDESARALIVDATDRAAWYGLSHVELRHLTPKFGDLPRKRHRVTMKLNVSGDADLAWEGLDRKVRNQIRKAEKSELTSEVGGAELLPQFYAVFAENMRDLGTPVYPHRWFTEIFSHFPQQSRVFLVRHGQKPVAGAVTFGYRDALEVPSAASLRSYRAMCPNMLLYWRIVQQAIADGVGVLDFGRSTPGEGTYKFKEQWGATPGPIAWEYVLLSRQQLPDRSPNNSRFHGAISLWQRLPLGLANALGPSVVRFLP